MSILIKGVKMPKSCYECSGFFNKADYHQCYYDKDDRDLDELNVYATRPEWCPLVEVPEHHGRLVDLDKLIDDMGLDEARKYGNKTARDRSFSYGTLMRYEIVDALEDTPVIIDKE